MKRIKILGILALVALVLFMSGCEERLSPEEIAAKIQEKQPVLMIILAKCK